MNISPTPYKALSDGLLPKLQNLGLGTMTEEEADELIYDYIRPAAARFKACKQNLHNRDDLLQTFHIELTGEEQEILCNFMLIEWLSANFINTPALLRQTLPSKDFAFFSSSNHLDALLRLRDAYCKETYQMVSAYSHTNSSLFKALKGRRTC